MRGALDVAVVLVTASASLDLRPATADAVARILDAFLAERGKEPLEPSEVRRIRDVLETLGRWNLGGRVDDWRTALEARLSAWPGQEQ
jgi:hypothetical protein